jgi:hypothetical protein
MTEERRSSSGSRREIDSIGLCSSHKRLEDNIDKILANQERYMEHQVDLVADVAEIKAIVNNGLKAKIAQTTDVMNELRSKMATLDNFQWFREFVNDLRNKMFKTLIKYALIGGILAFIASFFFSGGIRLWQLFLK